jgi:hypothetical protein
MAASEDTQNEADTSEQADPSEPSEESNPLNQTDIQQLLAALIEQARALATRIAGTPDRETNCHFCEAPLSLWENLLVLQLTGVAAHVQCPSGALAAKLKKVGPQDDFPYEEFCEAVQQRLHASSPTSCSGTIERPLSSDK